jgi:hypothetical protein
MEMIVYEKRGKMVQQGIYEEIINQKLKNELMDLDSTFNIGKEPIDVEEARKILSSYGTRGQFCPPVPAKLYRIVLKHYA